MHGQSLNFLFPNDIHIMWSLMIVLYPYITGLVAGAFIVGSLYHVFGRSELKPVSRLAMVASLSFLLVATLPLLCHLGHPERALNIVVTPHFTSAMSAFGLIYAMYLILVVLEIWLLFRREIVELAARSRGLKRGILKGVALGVYDISEEAQRVDHRVVTVLAALGIPAACILHGYVGFIFGSIKANPWWSTPLMPIVFLFSAIVSGIALVLLMYMATSVAKRVPIDMRCVDTIAKYLFYAFIIDFTLEGVDLLHRMYEADESFKSLDFMVKTKLFVSQILLQIVIGGLIPITLLAITQVTRLSETARKAIYAVSGTLTLVGIFAMRWNVVIGGQLFSKSFLGYTTYKMDFATREGLLPAIVLMILPFVILAVLVRLLPPWHAPETETSPG